MKIKSAKFVRSYPTYEQMSDRPVPEFAFIGRSNVGKSSLINYLTNRKNLALTSSKPGKTQLINQFLINDQWHLIDLPGYGYAKVSQKKRDKFSDLIQDYLLHRKQLMTAFVLIDSRLDPQAIDLEFIEWLGVNEIPFSIVFTKADKPNKTALMKNTELFKAAMYKSGWEDLPEMFITSASGRQGDKPLLKYISDLMG